MSKHFRSNRKHKQKVNQAHDLPILEDDEESNEFSVPILPNFAFGSSNDNVGNLGVLSSSPATHVPPPTSQDPVSKDPSSLTSFPNSIHYSSPGQSLTTIPSMGAGDYSLRRQIDDDFDRDFTRDAIPHNTLTLPTTDTTVEAKRRSRNTTFELHGNSSTDESTEDEADGVTPIHDDNGPNDPGNLKAPPPTASPLVIGGRQRAFSLRDRFRRRFTGHHEEIPLNDLEKQSSEDYVEKTTPSNEKEDASSINSRSHFKRRQSLFGKILGMDVNPGLTPASSHNSILGKRQPHMELDLEKGRNSMDDPMIQHVDPSEFKEAAKDMIKLHYNTENSSTTLTGSTLASTTNDSIHRNNPELLVDDFDDLRNLDYSDLNLPNSKAHPKRVKKGIASALLSLYQYGNASRASSVYSPSVMSSGTATPRSTAMGSDYDLDADDLNLKLKSIGASLENPSIINNGKKLSLPITQRPKHRRMVSNASSINLAFGNLNANNPAADEEFHNSVRKVKFDASDKPVKTNSAFPNFSKIKSDNELYSYDIDDDDDGGNDGVRNSIESDINEKESTLDSNDQSSFLGIPTSRFGYSKEKKINNKKNKSNTRKNKLNPNGRGRQKKRKFKKGTLARITVHIASVLQRERFILLLCKSLMLYGAPTHRLEEYMSMTAQVLEIDGSFIYLPGTMIVSFADSATRTTDMKLVRCPQGVDLGKLDKAYDIYKDVVHDRIGVEEASVSLENLINCKPKFNPWFCIFLYGFCSAFVGPWAFGSSWIDIPICFGVGLLIGFLQYVLVPKSSLYSSVFEVTASIVVSFIGRALGSINGGSTFCFAAIVQSTLALILPGYIILCGSLELQSRNLVAGAVRMFYAFIYSLMLSFGITLGSALYGWIDESATNNTTCTSNVPVGYRFLFVPMFTIGIALVNQASYTQLPLMVLISEVGYIVNYFASKHFKTATELNATLGCFIIGLMSNLYTRVMKSFHNLNTRGSFMSVSLMLPAIFVQVPSGIASQGSLLVGVTTANEIVHSNSSSTSTSSTSSTSTLNFGLVMIQVALGISVGLYLSTIVVYPTGKKRTGLFTL